jgi:cytosine/creatinine deaminase
MQQLMDFFDSGPARYRLLNAAVPTALLADVPPGATAGPESTIRVDISVADGKILSISAAGSSHDDWPSVDLDHRHVWPTLVDMHSHIDKGHVLHRLPPTGTIDDAYRATVDDSRHWTEEDLHQRMNFAISCAYVHGVSVVRTHLDSINGLADRSFSVFDQVRREWAGRVELQAVAIAGLDAFAGDEGDHLADLCARYGGIIGGVTDVIACDAPGVYGDIDRALDRVFALATARGLDVDLHVDQSADPAEFSLPNIAKAVMRNAFDGHVVCGHCVNLALQTPEVITDTVKLLRDAGVAIVTLPTPMMYLMDRHAGRTPRWRGVTAAHELRGGGVPIAIAGDNVRDAWYPYGDHDMVDTLRQAVRIFQLDDPSVVAMVGPVPAEIVRASDAGIIAAGRSARLIIFNARSHNAILCRPQSDRIVLDRGKRVTMALPAYEELMA